MSWSYDTSDLDNSTPSGRLNIVRFLVGDTDTLDQQVSDEEINFALATEDDDVYGAAYLVVRSLVAKYARYVDIDLDGQLSESYSQLYDHYVQLADTLQTQKDKSGVFLGVFAGGISKAEMKRVELLPDRVKPFFRRDSYKWPCWDEDTPEGYY